MRVHLIAALLTAIAASSPSTAAATQPEVVAGLGRAGSIGSRLITASAPASWRIELADGEVAAVDSREPDGLLNGSDIEVQLGSDGRRLFMLRHEYPVVARIASDQEEFQAILTAADSSFVLSVLDIFTAHVLKDRDPLDVAVRGTGRGMRSPLRFRGNSPPESQRRDEQEVKGHIKGVLLVLLMSVVFGPSSLGGIGFSVGGHLAMMIEPHEECLPDVPVASWMEADT